MIKWEAALVATGPARPAIGWARTGGVCAARALLRALTLRPLVRIFCARRRVIGRDRIPAGPVIFVANHAGHADTPLVLSALPRRHRARVAPAAAADYFFASPAAGALTQLIIGGFPFPRRGRDGLDRAHALLNQGWSVLLFPEGTRSPDGRIAPFKRGAAMLAARSRATVVPVGLAGTRHVLGKGRRIPRRRPVAVVFGAPIPAARATTDCMEAAVKVAAATARAVRATHRPWYARVRALASSRRGLWLAFAWGAAEALAWPIVPDLAVATLVLAAPRRMPHIAAAAIAGSLTGGTAAYVIGALGGAGVLDHVPLVTPRMQASAMQRISEHGAAGILSQPFSGIPFKVFAYQAPAAGIQAPDFAWFSLLARGGRLLQVAAVFALAGVVLRRWLPRVYPALVAAYTIVFFAGLARVVANWS